MSTKTIKDAEIYFYLLPGSGGLLLSATSKSHDGIKSEKLFCPGLSFEFDLTDHRQYGYIGDFDAIREYLINVSTIEPEHDWMRGLQISFDETADVNWTEPVDDRKGTLEVHLLKSGMTFSIDVPAIFRSYMFTHDRLTAYTVARSRYCREKVKRGEVPNASKD